MYLNIDVLTVLRQTHLIIDDAKNSTSKKTFSLCVNIQWTHFKSISVFCNYNNRNWNNNFFVCIKIIIVGHH